MKALQTQLILWGALLMSTLLIAGVSLLLEAPMAPPEGLEVLPIALGAVSLSVAALSFALPSVQQKRIFSGFASSVTEEVDGAEVAFYREQAPKVRVLRMNDALLERIAKASAVPLITSLGMSESIAINGLLLSRFGHGPLVVAPFLVFSVLLVGARLPSKARLLAALSKQLDAKVVEEGSSL